MRATAHLMLLALAAALTIVMCGPAGAAWTVSNPQYSYSNSPNGTIGTWGLATAQRTASNGKAYVKVTLWASVNEKGQPRDLEIKYCAWSRQSFKLTLTGSIPPVKPTSCPQRPSATGKLCHAFNELDPVSGIYAIEVKEFVGNLTDSCWPYYPSQPPATYRQEFGDTWTYESPSHVGPVSVSKTSQTPWRTDPIDWSPVNWVKAYAEAWIQGGSGKIQGESSACVTAYTVEYQQP